MYMIPSFAEGMVIDLVLSAQVLVIPHPAVSAKPGMGKSMV
jgi:hypothetical protein